MKGLASRLVCLALSALASASRGAHRDPFTYFPVPRLTLPESRPTLDIRRNHSDIEDPPLTATTPTVPTPTTQRPSFHGTGAIAFSTKGEYGVRLMVQLGRHAGTGPASLAEIAAEEDLPRAYLEQLVVSLREAGLVTSTRGAHGGYELARPPETISMAEVLRALEGPIAPMMCASDDPEHATVCDRSARCTVNVLWVRVRDAVTGALDSMTLADLVPPRAAAAPSSSPIQPTPMQGAVTHP
jgi:Rrf2 family transcriptional regulator, cysteine metabolism repressor